MTCFDSNPSLLRSLYTVARALALVVLAVPGAGFALVAAACGDMDMSAKPAHDVVARVDVKTVVAQPVVPALPAPAPVEVEPVRDEQRSLILPLETMDTSEPSGVEEDPEASYPCDEGIDTEAPMSLRIIEAEMASGVQNRQPVRAAEGFDIGEKAWAWIAVENTGETAPITMVWRRNGEVRSRMTLEVGKSPRWRTWSRVKMRSYDAGSWAVEILDTHGRLLRVLQFEVHPETVDVTRMPGFVGC